MNRAKATQRCGISLTVKRAAFIGKMKYFLRRKAKRLLKNLFVIIHLKAKEKEILVLNSREVKSKRDLKRRNFSKKLLAKPISFPTFALPKKVLYRND
jgi:hypothetical protein